MFVRIITIQFEVSKMIALVKVPSTVIYITIITVEEADYIYKITTIKYPRPLLMGSHQENTFFA